MLTRAAGPACGNGCVRLDPHAGHVIRTGLPAWGASSGATGSASFGRSVGSSLTRVGYAPCRPADRVTKVGCACSQHADSLLYRDRTVAQPGSSHIRTPAAFEAALRRSSIAGPNAVRPFDPPIRAMTCLLARARSRSEATVGSSDRDVIFT
jgi:hypothetical protein